MARSVDTYRPTLWRRLAASLKFFRHGFDWATKRAPFEWPEYRQRQPFLAPTDYAAYAEEGFAANSLIYAAILYKCRAVTAAPLRAYTGDVDQPEALPVSHPLSKLLARPNPYQSGPQFMQQNTAYLNLAGNVFVYVDRQGETQGYPSALYSLRPDRVLILPGERGDLRGYLYVPEGKTRLDGIPILPQDLMHVKLPNPLDELEGLGYGLSPLSALARSGDVDNMVTSYLQTFFQKGTMNNLILKFNVPLDDTQIAAIRKRWTEIYGGTENWSKIGVLDDSGEVQRLGLTFNEMGFEGIDARNESRILAPFGVPPILVGTRYGLERSTDTNYKNARRSFWEDTFIPELALYETTYDYYLAQGQDITIRFDTSEVPALREDVNLQVEAAYKLFSMGVPANKAVQAIGLQIENIPGGDTGYLPLNLVPVGTPGQAPALPSTGQPVGKPKPAQSEAESEGQEESAEGQAEAESETEEGRKGVVRPFRRNLGSQGQNPSHAPGGSRAGSAGNQANGRRLGANDAAGG